MNISYKSKSRRNVETEARKLGMVYPSEISNVNTKSWKD